MPGVRAAAEDVHVHAPIVGRALFLAFGRRGVVQRPVARLEVIDAATLELRQRVDHRAADGAEALAAAERLRPEVLFIDLNMPGLDGYELAKRLRALPWGRAATLVALTGMGQQSDIELARAAGFDIHLTKPADPERVSRIAAGSDGGANVLRFG